MASMNIKVPTKRVITSLEERLENIKTTKASEKINAEKYEANRAKWIKEIAKLCIANFSKSENVRVNVRYDGRVNIDFDLNVPTTDNFPEEPKRDYETIADYLYEEQVEEIGNAIRILKMTDEETVSAATFKSVSKYL
jgi:hypothetical protein